MVKRVTVRKGECELVLRHMYMGNDLCFLTRVRQHAFCIWLLTGTVHVSGWGPCRPSRHWQNRDHQGPGQSPGLALCCNQLRRRHGLQSKALASLWCRLLGQSVRVVQRAGTPPGFHAVTWGQGRGWGKPATSSLRIYCLLWCRSPERKRPPEAGRWE